MLSAMAGATDASLPHRAPIETRSGSPAELHHLDLDLSHRAAIWLEPTSGALVLGSAQRADTVRSDAVTAAGLDLVRRRSGGGAVLVIPGEVLWLDVVVPRGDRWWDDDIARSMWWLGELWASALDDVGVAARVHRGGMQRSPWSAAVCFAGVGDGEVVADGRKIVGISQRRTRAGARLQSMCHLVFRADEVASLCAQPPAASVLDALVVAAPVDGDLLRAAVTARLAAALRRD
jgi:lipoate-protein ligase A